MHSSFRHRHADRRRDKSHLSMQTVATITCVLPLGVRRTVKCGANRNLCHFIIFFLLDFASFFLNTSMNMLLLECQKHEKYNVKVGKVLNLIIYI